MLFQISGALLEVCVLVVLSREDTYGYVLTQEVKQAVEISESTLYPVLRRLQKEGMLTTYDKPYSGRLRRYYSITEEGREKLKQYLAEWEQFKNGVEMFLKKGDIHE